MLALYALVFYFTKTKLPQPYGSGSHRSPVSPAASNQSRPDKGGNRTRGSGDKSCYCMHAASQLFTILWGQENLL